MKKTHTVKIGPITMGGEHPIVVQSMTNTDTADIDKTVAQVYQLAKAGSELVRITVNTESAAAAVPSIRKKLDAMGCDVPLVGDFHFNGHKLLAKYPECAQMLAKYRINPGNVGRGSKRDPQFAQMIGFAIQYDKAIRIGVNWGSLDPAVLARLMDQNSQLEIPRDSVLVMHDAVITSALESADKAVEMGLGKDKIVLSCKMSGVQDLISVYQTLSKRCDYPLHLGLTEAGMGTKGVVSSTAALAILLQQGIGNTIRISLTPEPGGDRCQEVLVAQEILQSMELRSFTPAVISCPGCGRTSSDFFQTLAMDIQSFLRNNMSKWRVEYPGVEEMKVAVMGCVVNGPGESKNANIGISLPGTGEIPVAPVYIDGKKDVTLKGENIAEQFQDIVELYVSRTYKR